MLGLSPGSTDLPFVRGYGLRTRLRFSMYYTHSDSQSTYPKYNTWDSDYALNLELRMPEPKPPGRMRTGTNLGNACPSNPYQSGNTRVVHLVIILGT